ncbi:hypothetical protein IGI04_026423, partial [Brassica rapa subsp. trilocularis]
YMFVWFVVDVCIEFVLVCRVSMVASGLVSRGGGVEGGTWGELLERAGGVRMDAEECTRGLVDLLAQRGLWACLVVRKELRQNIVLQFYQSHGGAKRHDPQHLLFVDGEVSVTVVCGFPFSGNYHTVVSHGGQPWWSPANNKTLFN